MKVSYLLNRIRILSAALAGTLFFISCGGERLNDPYVSVPEKGVTVEDVVLNPDAYFGKQVTVAGTIKETFGEQAFMIHGEKMVDELLTVGADPYPQMKNDTFDYHLAPVKAVRVKGVVRKFNIGGIKNEKGIQIDETRFGNYEGKPVLYVNSLERVEP